MWNGDDNKAYLRGMLWALHMMLLEYYLICKLWIAVQIEVNMVPGSLAIRAIPWEWFQKQDSFCDLLVSYTEDGGGGGEGGL